MQVTDHHIPFWTKQLYKKITPAGCHSVRSEETPKFVDYK